jgi:hypothetical protein
MTSMLLGIAVAGGSCAGSGGEATDEVASVGGTGRLYNAIS